MIARKAAVMDSPVGGEVRPDGPGDAAGAGEVGEMDGEGGVDGLSARAVGVDHPDGGRL